MDGLKKIFADSSQFTPLNREEEYYLTVVLTEFRGYIYYAKYYGKGMVSWGEKKIKN